MTKPEFERLYRVAVDADDAFSAELQRVYGERACEERYRASAYDDAALETAAQAKVTADRELRQAFYALYGEP